MAADEVQITPTLRHVEVYTMAGLLTLLWHGDADAPHFAACLGRVAVVADLRRQIERHREAGLALREQIALMEEPPLWPPL